MFHNNKMGSLIRARGFIFYSLLYLNSRLGFHGLKDSYSVISVSDKRLPGNTQKWAIASFVDDQSAIFRILGGDDLVLLGVKESLCPPVNLNRLFRGCANCAIKRDHDSLLGF